jgi:hypothetical protein
VIVGLGGGRGVEATFEVREGRKESDSIYMCVALELAGENEKAKGVQSSKVQSSKRL